MQRHFNTMYVLIQFCFPIGHFSGNMSQRLYCPCFQKGDINDPNNYRGITIVSCLGKLFTSIFITDNYSGIKNITLLLMLNLDLNQELAP